MDRARKLATEIFEQPHWKTEAARSGWPVDDLVTDVAYVVRGVLLEGRQLLEAAQAVYGAKERTRAHVRAWGGASQYDLSLQRLIAEERETEAAFEALKAKNGESGRPVSEPLPEEARLSAAVEAWVGPVGPDITISGRPEGEGERLLRRWLAWFSADQDPRDEKFGDAPNLIDIVDATIKYLHATPVRQADDPDFGRAAREHESRLAARDAVAELARRDGPPRVGRGAEFPKDDGTYVVNVIPDPPRAPTATDCPSCDGRGVYFDYVNLGVSNEKRFFACKACDGTGRKKGESHV